MNRILKRFKKMFYAFALIICFKISSFAQNQPFILTEAREHYILDISEAYSNERRNLYKEKPNASRVTYWEMDHDFFEIIREFRSSIFPNILTPLSDLEEISSHLSSVFGFYELREENKLPRYVTPTLEHFNNIIAQINTRHENTLLPLKFYKSQVKQDLFQYLYRFVYEDSLPVVDPHLSIARYLHDTLHMKAGIVTSPLMVKVYKKLVNHFLFFFQYLLKNKHRHKDYMTLYDQVIMEIATIVDFDLGNVFIGNVFTQGQKRSEVDYYLNSTWGLPKVTMKLSFKEMLSNMISDLVTTQGEISLKKSITINTRDLINEFFESVPEMNPNVIFYLEMQKVIL
jgi:hypothetical protein